MNLIELNNRLTALIEFARGDQGQKLLLKVTQGGADRFDKAILRRRIARQILGSEHPVNVAHAVKRSAMAEDLATLKGLSRTDRGRDVEAHYKQQRSKQQAGNGFKEKNR